MYAVKVMPSSSAFVNSLFDSRYSTVTVSPLLSAAVIVTVCVSLKNRPKVMLLRNAFQLFSLILISPVGFSLSFHSALTVMSAVTVTGAFTGYSVPSISHALNCFPSGAINSHSGREYSLPRNTFFAGIAVVTSSGKSSGSEPPFASKVMVCSLRFSNVAVMVTFSSDWAKV